MPKGLEGQHWLVNMILTEECSAILKIALMKLVMEALGYSHKLIKMIWLE